MTTPANDNQPPARQHRETVIWVPVVGKVTGDGVVSDLPEPHDRIKLS